MLYKKCQAFPHILLLPGKGTVPGGCPQEVILKPPSQNRRTHCPGRLLPAHLTRHTRARSTDAGIQWGATTSTAASPETCTQSWGRSRGWALQAPTGPAQARAGGDSTVCMASSKANSGRGDTRRVAAPTGSLSSGGCFCCICSGNPRKYRCWQNKMGVGGQGKELVSYGQIAPVPSHAQDPSLHRGPASASDKPVLQDP